MNLESQLNQILEGLGYLTLELWLVGCAFLVLIVSLFKTRIIYVKWMVAAILMVACFLVEKEYHAFGGWLIQPEGVSALTVIFCVFTVLLLHFRTSKQQGATYYFLIISVLFSGVMIMKAQHLLLIYLSIELLSYGSYILTSFSFTKVAHEASIKYLLFGGVSSAIILFGITWLYGTSGSLLLNEISPDSTASIVGYIMFIGGFLFKAALVPFHIWLPDTYQGARPDTTAFFSVVPKAAALFALGRIVQQVQWGTELLLWVGIITMIAGTLGALRQSQVRRLVSYGTLVHAAFLLPLALLGNHEAFVWYAAVYAIMNLGIFYLIQHMERQDQMTLDDYNGLGLKHPWLAVLSVVVLLSLIGLPPTAGFLAKWMVFSELYAAHAAAQQNIWMIYLLVSVFVTAVALFYYLQIGYRMFFNKATKAFLIDASIYTYVVIITLALLGLFFWPELM